MSEQTPDTESGLSDGQDPSMEDILASIRKIIAEDDVKAPPIPETAIIEEVADTTGLGGDVSDLGHVETLDLDIISTDAPAIDPDIDALIGDMDATAPTDLAPTTQPDLTPASESIEDILDLEIPLEDAPEPSRVETVTEAEPIETETLVLEDEFIDLVADAEDDKAETGSETGLLGGAMAALGLGTAAATTAKTRHESSEPPVSDADDLSQMLDNMLDDSASYQESQSEVEVKEELVIDPAEKLTADDDTDDDILSELDFLDDTPETGEVISKNDPDIDLVKSLMADLTETPLHDETENIEAETEAVLNDTNDEAASSSDDIMDEILSITIDDETKLSEEVIAPEIAEPETVETAPAGMSLKEIAAAAEADAKESEKVSSGSIAAGLAAVSAGTIAAVTDSDDVSMTDTEIETEPSEAAEAEETLIDIEELLAENDTAEESLPTPEPIIEETSTMARAKKTDAIIDEVTETATAGAFASLSTVVEEKAVTAERGDRIGDLVMEALQPMLKEWLDANLKGIVERAVTKEVKRISSGK